MSALPDYADGSTIGLSATDPTGEALVDDGETIHAFSELRQRLGGILDRAAGPARHLMPAATLLGACQNFRDRLDPGVLS
jgi:hypothetical protein